MRGGEKREESREGRGDGGGRREHETSYPKELEPPKNGRHFGGASINKCDNHMLQGAPKSWPSFAWIRDRITRDIFAVREDVK